MVECRGRTEQSRRAVTGIPAKQTRTRFLGREIGGGLLIRWRVNGQKESKCTMKKKVKSGDAERVNSKGKQHCSSVGWDRRSGQRDFNREMGIPGTKTTPAKRNPKYLPIIKVIA